MNTTRSLTAATIAAAALVLAGCTSDVPDDPKPSPTGTITLAPARTSPAPTGPLMYTLKDTADWDGISVRLTSITRGRTTDAGVPEDTDYLRFTITVKNTTADPYNLDNLFLHCATEAVYDGLNGLEGAPNVHVLPEKSIAWEYACAQNKGEKYFQVEINPEFGDARTAIFSGTVE